MRLLLDVHFSGSRVGGPLRRAGHDVLAAEEEADLRGLPDESLLSFATRERRILLTADTSDFGLVLAAWAERQESHAGCILVPNSVRNNDYGALLRGVGRLLGEVGTQDAWTDLVRWLPRAR